MVFLHFPWISRFRGFLLSTQRLHFLSELGMGHMSPFIVGFPHRLNHSEQISIIPKPEFFGDFWGIPLLNHICPDSLFWKFPQDCRSSFFVLIGHQHEKLCSFCIPNDVSVTSIGSKRKSWHIVQRFLSHTAIFGHFHNLHRGEMLEKPRCCRDANMDGTECQRNLQAKKTASQCG